MEDEVQLPDEVLLHIFQFIDPAKDTLHMCLVCNRWNSHFKDMQLWKGFHDQHLGRFPTPTS